MYSEKVTISQLEKIESKLNLKLHRYSPSDSIEITSYLTTLKDSNKLFDSSGNYLRRDHAIFVRNERILFQQDFNYALRYIKIVKDAVEGGGLGHFQLWESQEILMRLISKLEEHNIDYYTRNYPCDGILICDNKGGRQLGHTMLGRALTIHRVVAWPFTRAMGASVDEDKLLELYDRDKRILDNLPFFLQPESWGTAAGGYDKKGEHIQLASLDSSILYQQAKQQSGIGTGRQFDVNHNTEVSQWPYPRSLELDFFPALPQNPYTFSLQETTPQGRKNWWHDFSERVRHGKMPRWAYCFVPFYAEPKKYRRHAPDEWKPDELTLQMAWKVYNTSTEFVGKQVTLDRDQLYWWATSYAEARENNSLNLFLSNYSITPEQSFQHTTQSAINTQTLDWMRGTTIEGIAYELEF